MSRASVINPYQQFFADDNVTPLAGGELTFYLNGTATLASIYSDPDLTVAQSNPYTLDSGGRIRGDVRFANVLSILQKDSDGTTIRTVDDVTCFDDVAVYDAWSSTTIYGSGGRNIVTASDNNYYVSLQPNNLNKDPTSEPTWWQLISFIESTSAGVGRINDIADITPSSQLLITGTSSTWEGGVTLAGSAPGFIGGLETSNGTDSDHDIDVAVGRCNDSTDAVSMVLSSSFTKQIDATWASGTGNGGLASGASLAVDTWYHVFVVLVGGSVDVMFDTSVTCANGVANNSVTNFRRIGSILTDGSSNITAYFQEGDYFFLDQVVLDVNTLNPGTSAVTAALTVPLGIQTIALYSGFVLTTDAANDTYALFTSPSQTDTAPTSSLSQLKVAQVPTGESFYVQAYLETETNTSSQIRYRLSYSAATITMQINTSGWIDKRGQ